MKAVLPCAPLPLAPALAAATRVLSHPDVGEVGAVRREAHRTGGVGDVLCGEGGRVGGVSAGALGRGASGVIISGGGRRCWRCGEGDDCGAGSSGLTSSRVGVVLDASQGGKGSRVGSLRG